MLTIKKAGTESIAIIQQLVFAIWPVCYKDIVPKEQIDYMLELIYSKAALTQQIENLHHQFVFVYDDDKPVGFASYSPKVNDATIFRLNKIYLLTDQQGKGTGKFLLSYVIEQIRVQGAKALELNVNKKNPALHFYTKNNFAISREEVINIGNGYVMDDYVMTLALER